MWTRGQSLGPLRPVWRFFGADEPNYAYLPDGERLIGELGGLKPGDVYSAPTTCSRRATGRRV